jgi:hypothetical protein
MPKTDITERAEGNNFNNFGIPGAKSFHLNAPGYGNLAGVLAGTANPILQEWLLAQQQL